MSSPIFRLFIKFKFFANAHAFQFRLATDIGAFISIFTASLFQAWRVVSGSVSFCSLTSGRLFRTAPAKVSVNNSHTGQEFGILSFASRI